MHAMIDGYYEAGWEVYLLAMNTIRHRVDEIQLKKLYRHLYAFEWMDIDNDVKPIPLLKNLVFSKLPEHVERFFHDTFLSKIIHVLNDFKPDVVQLESVYLTTYLSEIRQHSNALTVLRVHNIEYHVWHTLARTMKNPVKKLYFKDLATRIRKYEKRAWSKYDLLLPITSKDSALIDRVTNVKAIRVAPFSLDLKSKPLENTEEAWVGYHIGAMDWIPNRDGVKWFLEMVWPLIHQTIPDFQFYFAGRKMPDYFKTLDIPGVHCMDEVPSADEFIADKKILIVPLWSGSGIRVKILEAMAAGKVVISTVAGIKGIDAKPKEHYLAANEPDDFVKAIQWCMKNKEEAESMGQRARDLVMNRYEQSVVIKKVIAEVEQLIHEK